MANISNSTVNTLISGTTSADSIYNDGYNVTINAGAGNDSIFNDWVEEVSVNGGAGNDTLYTKSDGNNTLTGGAGSDLFRFYYDSDSYYGTDVITDYAEEDTIEIEGALITNVYTSGSDVVFEAGNNELIIKDAADKEIDYTNENYYDEDEDEDWEDEDEDWEDEDEDWEDEDEEYEYYSNWTGTNGNDYHSNSGDEVTLDGGAGNDTIENDGWYVSINGGAGNDYISNVAEEKVTIKGGTGNDYIYNSGFGVLYQYSSGDGNDTINGFDGELDSFSISGVNFELVENGSNVIISLSSGNSITLLDAYEWISEEGLMINGSSYYLDEDEYWEEEEEEEEEYWEDEDEDGYSNWIGTSGNDYYENSGDEVTLDGGAGNDTIDNSGAYVSINGGAGNDYIYNGGDGAEEVTIKGGTGNDYIYNDGLGVLYQYSSGDGNDTITGFDGEFDSFSINGVNFELVENGSNVIISLSSGNSITLLDADEWVSEEGIMINGSSYYLDEDEDWEDEDEDWEDEDEYDIYNDKDGVLVNGTSGDDYIGNDGDYATIKAGDGNDSIWNTQYIGNGDNSSINMGAGNDIIHNFGDEVTIIGGKGNDSIGNNYYLSDGSTFNDYSGSKVVFKYTEGDGNDIIGGFREDSTLQINGGSGYSAQLSGSDIIVTVGTGKITLLGAASLSVVNIAGDEVVSTLQSITNATTSPLTLGAAIVKADASTRTTAIRIVGNALNNSILGGTKNDTISGGDGNDYLAGNAGNDSLSGGNGADTLAGGAGADSILGGDGNDTLVGGKGNDSLVGGDGADIFIYNTGDGNDRMVDYTEEDKIVVNGVVSSVTTSGNNVILTVGSGKISVIGGKDKTITYIDDSGTYTYPVPSPIALPNSKGATLLSGYAQSTFDINDYEDYADTVITIDASAVEHSLAITGNANANRIIGSEENDYIDGGAGADSILGGDGNDTLVGGKGNDSLFGGDGADTFVYTTGDGNDRIIDYENEDSIVVNGVVSSVTTSGNNVILTVGSGKISVIGGKDKTITYTDSTGIHPYPEVVNFNSAGTGATLLAGYAQSTFNINDYEDYVGTLKTIDASAVEHSISITGNANANVIVGGMSNAYIDGGAGNDTLKGSNGNDYLAGNAGNDSLSGGNGADTLAGGAGADKLIGEAGNDSLNGGDGNDSLSGGGGADKLFGGAGNDTLNGGTGNDTLTSGAGNDLFIYALGDGNDVITDMSATDTLKIGNGTTDTYSKEKSGNNVIVTVGNDKITLTGAATLSSVKILGTEIVSTLQTITNNDASPLTLGAAIVKADASTRTTAIRIVGNALNNSILGGNKNDTLIGGDGNDYLAGNAGNDSLSGGNGADTLFGGAGADKLIGGEGNDSLSGGDGADSLNGGAGADKLLGGAGNDTLNGGTGNDTLTSGAGNDLFIYALGDGNDVITDMSATDTLKIGNGTTDTYSKEKSGNNLIVTVGNDKITLTGAATLSSVKILGTEIVSTLQTITNNDASPLTLGAAIVKADASSRTTAIRIVGNALNNSILGGNKNDTLIGGDGNDYLAGNAGNDSLSGGNGADTLFGGAGADKLIGGEGNDSLSGGDGADSLSGGAGADKLLGGAGNDTLNGGTGNDTLTSGAGNDLFIYALGDGNDVITDMSATDTLKIGNGTTDTYSKEKSGNNLIVTVGNDKITLTGAATLSSVKILGTEIVSTLQTITNNDASPLTLGAAIVKADASSRTTAIRIVGNALNNSILGGTKNDTLIGGDGNDYISGNAGNDSLSGGNGADTLFGGAGADKLIGGEGNDSLSGGDGADSLNGGAGADKLLGGAGNDTLNGGTGNDTLTSGAGNDLLIYALGDGNDVITDMSATDTLKIGNGTTDTYAKEKSGNNFILTVGDGKITLMGAATLSSVKILGTEIVSTLQTITNNDASPLTLGAAIVKADASTRTTAIRIVGNAKANTILGGTKNDTLIGGDGNDYLAGNAGNDSLSGGNGADTLFGGAGADKLIGGEGNDSLSGGDAKDTLSGGDGNDTLWGGLGNDTLTGGDGADIFVYNAGDGNDIITDYDEDDGDIISIASGTVSNITEKGDDIIFAVGNGSITVKEGEDEIITYYDASGIHTYPTSSKQHYVTDDKTKTITLLESYTNETFDLNKYPATIETVDASKVRRALLIKGNDFINRIIGTEDNDSIDGGGGRDTLIGSEGNDSLNGGGGNDSLNGGDDDDTLIGGAATDTLFGGNGADVFVYNNGDGNDRINDYKDKDGDIIKVNGTVVSDVTTSGNNVIMTIGNGKISVIGGKDKVITYEDADGPHTYSKIGTFSSESVILLAGYTQSSFNISDYEDYADSVVTINAAKITRNIEIIGNSQHNLIIGSSTNSDYLYGLAGNDTLNGGGGDDTLNGGIGNDTLIGGQGKDVFVYKAGEGNDYIDDYNEADDDIIKVLNGSADFKVDGENVIMTVNNNKITIKGGAGKEIHYTDNGSNNVKKITVNNDLLFDDNYSADAASLSDIVKPAAASYTPYDFSATFSLTKEENFAPALTYSDKKS